MNADVNATRADRARPFKAAQSYGPADGVLFHGRDAEGASLAKFLAERTLAVLTAPTGMGKTSLLHAKVLPLLEAEGWLTVCARPEDNPSYALQAGLADHLLPDPRHESAVIDRLLAASQDAAATLAAAQAWYAERPVEEQVVLRLFAPEVEVGRPLPMMCRLLRGSIGILDLIEHFEALVVDGEPLGLTPEVKLIDLAKRLEAPETAAHWGRWRNRIMDAPDFETALLRFQNEWVPLRPGLRGILLVLDQFEEVFTQLGRSMQDAFVADIERLHPTGGAAPGSKPVHLTLALRKEFFADLVPMIRAFGSIERLTFFLGPLPVEQARQALCRPAALFGLRFAGAEGDGALDCLDGILSMAVDESEGLSAAVRMADGLVDPTAALGRMHFSPTLISLIGAYLWQRLEQEPSMPQAVSLLDFKRLVPRLDDVFSRFLGDAMDQVDSMGTGKNIDRFDALEMLDRLVTSSGFRNIIAQSVLVDQMPMLRDHAETLLRMLDRQLKLVRVDSRRGERFVEITHERLIPPVRRLISETRRRDAGRGALGGAHDMLYVLPDEPDPTKDPLPAHFRDALLRFLPRLELDALAAKHMARSLLVMGPDGDGRATLSRQRWRTAFLSVARDMSRSDRPSSERMRLLAGAELDAAIAQVSDLREKGEQHERWRHVATSALSDCTQFAPERIRRMFTAIAKAGRVN